MPNPLLKRISTLAAKVESTVGTAESLAAADGAINVYDVEIQADIEIEEREAQGTFSRLKGSPGARAATITFRADMGWDGTAQPLWASALWLGCGLEHQGSGVYGPVSETPYDTNCKSLTIGVWQDGLYKQMHGCMGNFKIIGTAGKMGMMEFEFKGLWNPVTDSAIIDPTYPLDLPMRFAEQNFTYNSVEWCVESCTFDLGNNVILRECAVTESGYKSALVTDRYPKISVNPEAMLIADQDQWQYWLDAEEYALTFGFTGPEGAISDGKLIFNAPKAQILNMQEAERNLLATNDIELGINKNANAEDQDFTLTFTNKA